MESNDIQTLVESQRGYYRLIRKDWTIEPSKAWTFFCTAMHKHASDPKEALLLSVHLIWVYEKELIPDDHERAAALEALRAKIDNWAREFYYYQISMLTYYILPKDYFTKYLIE